MMKPLLLLALGLSSFSLVSCDSAQESARKNQIEQKADALENKADQVRQNTEAAADRVEEKKADVEATADAIRTEGERKADALEDAADIKRDEK